MGRDGDFYEVQSLREQYSWLLGENARLEANVIQLQAICREAWDSLPGTYADDDPLAARHAAALRGCHEAASAAGKES